MCNNDNASTTCHSTGKMEATNTMDKKRDRDSTFFGLVIFIYGLPKWEEQGSVQGQPSLFILRFT